MQTVNIFNFKALSTAAKVSKQQIIKLRRGQIEEMRLGTLLKISSTLQIAIADLIATFSSEVSQTNQTPNNLAPINLKDSENKNSQLLQDEIVTLKAEYSRLEQKLEQQKELLQQEWKQSTLQIIESLLLQFPTAAQKARENPQLSAANLVPLIQKPVEKLLYHWDIQVIGKVNAEIPYNPQEHQLLEGSAQAGDIVKIRYIGYRQGDKLLYRAKVISV
ncbi:MAG: helix-turn-helix transcriptional regulator [Cyanobacteria bacterium P01_A01_bin.84]